MEMVENHNGGVITAGFYKYKRKGTSIPVLPPTVPSANGLLQSEEYYKMSSTHYAEVVETNVVKNESHIVHFDIQLKNEFPRPVPEFSSFLDQSKTSIEEISKTRTTVRLTESSSSTEFISIQESNYCAENDAHYKSDLEYNGNSRTEISHKDNTVFKSDNNDKSISDNAQTVALPVLTASSDEDFENRTILSDSDNFTLTTKRRVYDRISEMLQDDLLTTRERATPVISKPPTKSSSAIKDLENHLRYGITRLSIPEKSSTNKSYVYTKAKSTCGDSRKFSAASANQRNSPRRVRKNCSAEILSQSKTNNAAATFFVRAAEKLNLNSSPHRRKRRGSVGEERTFTSNGFAGILHSSPPPVPPVLLRRIDQKEVTGIGKVKVMLRISGEEESVENNVASEDNSCTSFFNVDKKRKQITLYEPSTCATSTDMPQDRKLGIAAPKMFAFDAVFSEEDSQVEICGTALTDVLHAVITGNDGCLFCFGNSRLGKTKTMIGNSNSESSLGMIPCAISWLFKGINEQKQKIGTRFSVRVSAMEITVNTQQIKDLLVNYASESEQSPSAYLRDDQLFGTALQNQTELRAQNSEKAGFYLDAALADRTTAEESHFLYTMHIYQYSVAGKGGVAGGRSRLHLLDLAGYDRSKPNCGMSLSGLGNVLLAIFNGQRHLPHREQKITHVLKECLSSLTCHAAMIAHVSEQAQRYSETLITVQLASRIHRMRRRRFKFPGISNGVNTTDESGKLTGSSDFDPSSSEQSADTVIYLGPAEETDGEHPPVNIPSLNSNGSIGKVLRDSELEGRFPPYSKVNNLTITSRSMPGSPQKSHTNYSPTHQSALHGSRSKNLKSSGFNSARSSPIRNPNNKKESSRIPLPNGSPSASLEERWIDGPRISKSRVVEGRNVHIMKTENRCVNLGRRELWVDGPPAPETTTMTTKHSSSRTPTKSSAVPLNNNNYGFMDNYKRNMIRKWVETQCANLQTTTSTTNGHLESSCKNGDNHHGGKSSRYKYSTTFKTFQDPSENDGEESDSGRGRGSGQEQDSEDEISSTELVNPQLPYPVTSEIRNGDILRVTSLSEYQRCGDGIENDDEEMELEIIEVEEPEEPVPMQDCCLQVTEEDIAFCMRNLENPHPEVEEHPLRILSQENLTVVSTFTDSLSVANDLDRLFPHSRPLAHHYQMPETFSTQYAINHHLPTNREHLRFLQLSKLHDIYNNKHNNDNSLKYLNEDCTKNSGVSRCQSVTISEMFNNENQNNAMDFDNGSIASEPAYLSNEGGPERFCENCKVNLAASKEEIGASRNIWLQQGGDGHSSFGSRFSSYRHIMRNMLNLRHPDGASNPNLHGDERRDPKNGDGAEKETKPNGILKIKEGDNFEDDDEDLALIPPPLPSKLLTLSREGFECPASKKSNGNCGYSYGKYKNEKLQLNGGSDCMQNGIRELNNGREGNLKKFDANCNHLEKLFELQREQKQLMNDIATAKQRFHHYPAAKWNLEIDKEMSG